MSVFSFQSVALILAFIDNTFLRELEPGMVKRGGLLGIQLEAFHLLRSFCGKLPKSQAIRALFEDFNQKSCHLFNVKTDMNVLGF